MSILRFLASRAEPSFIYWAVIEVIHAIIKACRISKHKFFLEVSNNLIITTGR